MSTQQYLADTATRHQVFLQRYAGGQSKKAIKTLNRLRRDIIAQLAMQPIDSQAIRLNELLREITALSELAYKKIGEELRVSNIDLAQDEVDFTLKVMDKATTATFTSPSSAALIASVEAMPMINKIGLSNMTVNDAIRKHAKAKTDEVTQLITDGITLGKSTPNISKDVSGLISTLQRRQLDTLVRTATNQAANIARDMMMEQNRDLLDGYRWISTLDSRTTLVCAGRDQKVYEVGLGPKAPAHWGCRSIVVPEVSPDFTIAKLTGERGAKGASGKEAVSGKLSYGSWLKRQPVEFVDEALGVERSRLFRSGKITIDKFTDPTGRVYTLDELKRMNNIALNE